MRNRTCGYALLLSLIAVPASAQAPAAPSADTEVVPPPAWAYNDVACSPALLKEKRSKADEPQLRVVGLHDSAVRELLGPGDVLVISGGSNAGLEPGQRFFVRRVIPAVTMMGPTPPSTIHTAGWVQILGVDTTVATATVIHACEGILLDDYLEPFVSPTIAARPLPGSTPQYEQMGHIMTGIEGLQTAALGNLMTIDRGSNTGVVLGQRYLVFRDKRDKNIDIVGRSAPFAAMARNSPLVEVGEVLVIAVRADDATVQVVRAKDAISNGDLIAPLR